MTVHNITTAGPVRVRIEITAADGQSPLPTREPGVGAVVQDQDGVRWFRADRSDTGWINSPDGEWREWEQIQDPTILLGAE